MNRRRRRLKQIYKDMNKINKRQPNKEQISTIYVDESQFIQILNEIENPSRPITELINAFKTYKDVLDE